MSDNFVHSATSNEDLLSIISWKDEMIDDAKQALQELAYRYDEDLLEKCEAICDRWNYSKTVALQIRDCTFSRVWKYAGSFNPNKVNAATIDEGIKLWLYKIANSQLANFHREGTCFEPKKEDLDIITTTEEMAEFISEGDVERKRVLKNQLEVLIPILDGLNKKKRIIYLTYKTYDHLGVYPPRSALKNLRNKLSLAQASLRKYYSEACEYVDQYLNNLNGK